MKKNKALILGALTLGAINLCGCSTKTEEVKPIENNERLEEASEAIKVSRNKKETENIETESIEKETESVKNETNKNVKYSNADLKLYKTLAEEEGNVTFSPYSLRDCIGIVYNGASDEVKDLLDAEFGFANNDTDYYNSYDKSLKFTDGFGVKVANKGYLKEGSTTDNSLNLDCLNVSDIEEIDMSDSVKAADTMNKYISDNTENKIKDLITPDNILPDTRLVAINALYFKQGWNQEAKSIYWKKSEHIDAFGGEDTDLRIVKEVGDLNVLRIPYDNCNYSMYIICDSGDVDGRHVDDYLNSITMEEYMDLLNFKGYKGLKNYDKVVYTIPEFEMDCKFKLSNHLIKNGYDKLFSDNALSKLGDVSISEILQGTYIKVNKDGTEAAAATAMMVKDNAVMFVEEQKIKYVIADDVFHFAIKDDKTNEILFMGRVEDIKNE